MIQGNALILISLLVGIVIASPPPAKALNSMQAQRSVQFMQPAKAQVEGRRDLINGVAAALAAAVVPKNAFAVSPVDIKDDRKAVAKGFDIIYEARDLDLDQRIRDGQTQVRESPELTKKRVVEAKQRLTTEVLPGIEKEYWPQAIQSLRRQVGNLRFDLNTLADGKPAGEKKVALKARQEFLTKLETLDFNMKKKNKDKALELFPGVVSSLDDALKVM